MRRIVLLSALVMALGQTASQAQVVVYDNTTDFTGTGISVGAAGTAAQGAVTITEMFTDDIHFLPNAGNLGVTLVKFTVANFSATAVNARPRVRFFADDNGGTAPGTFLTGFSFNPITFPAASVVTLSFNPGAGALTIPGSASMWSGLLFDNAGGATATATDLQNLGVGIFSSYATGSGSDAYFLSPAPASGSYLVNNPAGVPEASSPSGSFGWQFQVQNVPEPGSLALCGLAVGGLIGWRRRRAG